MIRNVCHWMLVTLVSALPHSQAENWPQFRGVDAQGVSQIPASVQWDMETGEGVLWKTPIPGLAHACPVIWEDQVIVATAVKPGDASLKVGLYGDIASVDEQEEHDWRLMCLNRKDGTVQWDISAFKGIPKVKRHTKATHCNSTPATNGQRIVALFGSEGLFCFDMQGQLLWKKDLGAMDSGYFKVPDAQWGFASSPIIHDQKVIVQCDVQKGSFLGVFDLEDGDTHWRIPRADVPTWSTPAVVQTPRGKQIIVNGWKHLGAYAFSNGEEIWKLTGGGDIPVPTPIAGHGRVYMTSAHGKYRPMHSIWLHAKGDITPETIGDTNEHIAWSHARKGNYMQTPILAGDYLFGCSDFGILHCFDALTGEVHFDERIGRGRDGFTASPIVAGDKLYLTSEQGKVYVIPVEKAFSIEHINDMGETCMATPAAVGGTLFWRTRHHLVAIGE